MLIATVAAANPGWLVCLLLLVAWCDERKLNNGESACVLYSTSNDDYSVTQGGNCNSVSQSSLNNSLLQTEKFPQQN